MELKVGPLSKSARRLTKTRFGSPPCSTGRLSHFPRLALQFFLVLTSAKAKATDDELRNLSKVLGIEGNGGGDSVVAELGSHWYPNRGIGPIPPTDPVIYRLFEVSRPYVRHSLII